MCHIIMVMKLRFLNTEIPQNKNKVIKIVCVRCVMDTGTVASL